MYVLLSDLGDWDLMRFMYGLSAVEICGIQVRLCRISSFIVEYFSVNSNLEDL